MDSSKQQLLNVGCGRHFHPAWRNLDVTSFDPAVESCDLRTGLPAPDSQYDMVYHSHVLEHLSPADGRALISECYRVLKPGGILRIAVPDLEQIARLYLQHLELAWASSTLKTPGDLDTSRNATETADAVAKYEWMTLELLDQMVRQRSGGNMGQVMQSATGTLAQFIAARLGREVSYAKSASTQMAPTHAAPARPAHSTHANKKPWRVRWAHRALRWLLGKAAVHWLEVGEFLDSGEVHRWMYDRFSLRQLCLAHGFTDFQVVAADESRLPGYAIYELDITEGQVRKPDSLFVECRKP